MNWHSAPAYKRAKLFIQKISQLAPLPNTFNIENSKDLIHKLRDTTILPHFTFVSLDITGLYSNIPVTETKGILADILKHKLIDSQMQCELLNLYEAITNHNYFTNNKNIIVQNDGLAMADPSSSIITEIFLQHTEHSHLACLTNKHSTVNYLSYVDDILLNLTLTTQKFQPS